MLDLNPTHLSLVRLLSDFLAFSMFLSFFYYGIWFLLGNFVFVFAFFFFCSFFPDLDLSYGGSSDGESSSDLGFSKWLESVRGKPGLLVIF